jgi:hypothetical protein
MTSRINVQCQTNGAFVIFAEGVKTATKAPFCGSNIIAPTANFTFSSPACLHHIAAKQLLRLSLSKPPRGGIHSKNTQTHSELVDEPQ